MKKVARLRVAQDEFVPPTGGKINIESIGVRTTGRIKKPKAVFDPSDNYVPRAQRLSQVATQAQHVTSPKSLLFTAASSPTTTATVKQQQRERSLSTGSNASNNSSSQEHDICIVCQKREPRRGGNYRNKLFPCIDCNRKVHKMCASVDFYETAPVRQSYKCENCRICDICDEQKGDLITCAKCCKSYHFLCHIPKVCKNPQTQRQWKCFKCIPNSSAAIANNGNIKEEPIPVTVIRQIIGDDINLQPLQSNSQTQVALQQKHEQPPKNSRELQQPKIQDRVNIAEAAAEAKARAAANAEHVGDLDEKSGTSSSSASSTDDSEDEDYNYVEKKKRKLITKTPELDHSNGKDNDFVDIEGPVTDADLKKSPVLNAAHRFVDDLPNRDTVRTWSVEHVAAYINKYFPNEAQIFKEQEIDGNALLLLKRSDIVKKLPLKLGPSLRLYNLILKIQTQKSNDPTIGWDCSVDTCVPSTL